MAAQFVSAPYGALFYWCVYQDNREDNVEDMSRSIKILCMPAIGIFMRAC